MPDFVPKEQYDRIASLLEILIRDQVCITSPYVVIKYLLDIGFTDDELVNLVNFSRDDIIKVRNDLIKNAEAEEAELFDDNDA